MFQASTISSADKPTFYRDLDKQLAGLLSGERDFIANAANLSALIFNLVPDLNWAGFYLMHGNDLLLGPFQGKPACVRIPVLPQPRGVCGAAAFERKTQLVPNVHEFPGHIACDSASNAEIVVPLLAAALGLPPGCVRVVTGRSSARKAVVIEGLTATEVAQRLGSG